MAVTRAIECTNFVRSSMADIAYYLSKDYWNQGIMTESSEIEARSKNKEVRS